MAIGFPKPQRRVVDRVQAKRETEPMAVDENWKACEHAWCGGIAIACYLPDSGNEPEERLSP